MSIHSFRNRSRVFRWIFLVTLCGTAAACGTPTPSGPVQLTVGINSYISFAPFFIAQEEGFFAEQNLEIEFEMFETSMAIIPALEQGLLDASGDASVAALFNAIQETGNIRIVADRGYAAVDGCNYMAILAQPEWIAENPTLTAEGIRGKSFSIDPTSFNAYLVETLLETVGLTLDDIRMAYIPNPNLIEAANNQSVDFMMGIEPWLTRLTGTGKMQVWKPVQEIVPNQQIGFLDFGKRLTQDDPDAGIRFATAYLQAVRQYNQGKTERNIAILSQYTKLAPESLQSMCWPPMNGNGTVHLESVLGFQQWAVGAGQLGQVSGESAIWDPRFTDAAVSALGSDAS